MVQGVFFLSKICCMIYFHAERSIVPDDICDVLSTIYDFRLACNFAINDIQGIIYISRSSICKIQPTKQ